MALLTPRAGNSSISPVQGDPIGLGPSVEFTAPLDSTIFHLY